MCPSNDETILARLLIEKPRYRMPALADSRDAPFVADDFLADNLEQLAGSGHTAREVQDAEGLGSVRRLLDGTPVVNIDGRALGAPPGFDHLRSMLRDRMPGPILLFGWGLGHLARALRAETNDTIAIYDPAPGVLRTVLEHGPSDIGAHAVFTNLHDLVQAWPIISRHEPRATVVRSQGYAEAFPDAHAELLLTVEQLVQRVNVNANTWDLRARTWVENLLENVDLLRTAPTALALEGCFRGVPAFVVGSGPSLAKNIEFVRQAAKKGIVFCANSTARALAAAEVEPQVIGCIESIDVSHRLADLPFIDRAVRAFSIVGHPAVSRTGRGPLLPIYESLDAISRPLQELTGRHGVPLAGSVSTALFSLAERLGCGPIVLVGQDMAYTDGHPYAAGTGYETSRARVCRESGTIELDWNHEVHSAHGTQHGRMHDREPLFEVPAWGGEGTVPAGPAFNGVRLWFEGAAITLAEQRPEVTVVNATEGGARIVGFEERSLAEVVEKLPERNITSAEIAAEAALHAKLPTASEIRDWAERHASTAREARRAAELTRKLSEHALAASRGGDPSSVSVAFAELGKSEKELRERLHAVPFIETWAHAAVTAATRKGHADHGTGGTTETALGALREEAAVTNALAGALEELEGAVRAVATRLKEQPSSKVTGRESNP